MFCKNNNYLDLENILKDKKYIDIDINIGDYDDRRPLHIAVEEKSYECIAILLKYNADLFVKDRWNNYPLYHAISNNDKYAILIFISNYYIYYMTNLKKKLIVNWYKNINK